MKVLIAPIRTERDHKEAISRIESIWGSKRGTPEGDELDILLTLVAEYEAKEYPTGPADPINIIRSRMSDLGLSYNELLPFIGSKGNLSEIMNRKRRLTIDMIRGLSALLNVPVEDLVGPSPETAWSYVEALANKYAKEPESAVTALRGLETNPRILCYRNGNTHLVVLGPVDMPGTQSEELAPAVSKDVYIETSSAAEAVAIANAVDVWAYSLRHAKGSTRFDAL